MRIEGEQTKQPFTCIRYFFIRPVVRLLRENAREIFSTLHFAGGEKRMQRGDGGGEGGREKIPRGGGTRTWRKDG